MNRHPTFQHRVTRRILLRIMTYFGCIFAIFLAVLFCKTSKPQPSQVHSFSNQRTGSDTLLRTSKGAILSPSNAKENLSGGTNKFSLYDRPDSEAECGSSEESIYAIDRYISLKDMAYFDVNEHVKYHEQKDPYLVERLHSLLSSESILENEISLDEEGLIEPPKLVYDRMAGMDMLSALARTHQYSHSGREAVEALSSILAEPVKTNELSKRRILYVEKLEAIETLLELDMISSKNIEILSRDSTIRRLLSSFHPDLKLPVGPDEG